MNTRHSRQSFLGKDSEVAIAQSTVGIIGLCGGGSHVAQQCAHIGIGKLLTADFDFVDETNLNRMIGSKPKDAEEKVSKLAVIERMVADINPKTKVQKLEGRWLENELMLRTATAIVGCVDSYSERDSLERFCRYHRIPYVDIGMDVHETKAGYAITGQVIISAPGEICMRCMGFITNEKLALEQNRYGAAGGKPQVVWPNGVLASVAVGHLMGLLCPWTTDMKPSALIEYDGNRQILRASSKLEHLHNYKCTHF